MTVMLIDGNSLTYRAFFALPTDMATASGQVTNAVYGFTSMLVNLLKDHRPTSIAVAFDRPEPTFRHEQLPSYKATRNEAPDILRQQIPDLKMRVVNVVDLMTLQPQSEHPHGISDEHFDRLFTRDKPIIFAFHGYPYLIHRLTYRRTNHDQLHVRGF